MVSFYDGSIMAIGNICLSWSQIKISFVGMRRFRISFLMSWEWMYDTSVLLKRRYAKSCFQKTNLSEGITRRLRKLKLNHSYLALWSTTFSQKYYCHIIEGYYELRQNLCENLVSTSRMLIFTSGWNVCCLFVQGSPPWVPPWQMSMTV